MIKNDLEINLDTKESSNEVFLERGMTSLGGGAGSGGGTVSIRVGNVYQGTPGSKPIVRNVGNDIDAVFEFTIPSGKDGKDGTNGTNGQDGYTPIKGVDYFDGADGKDGINGSDGKDGTNGQDGYTPQKGVDYFDGTDGRDGVDGYTPQKGIDYFDGAKGADGKNATINGRESIEIEAGNNVQIEETERGIKIHSTATSSGTGESSGNVGTENIKYYDSVSNMKADTSLSSGMVAITYGYYVPNDDGGSTYKIVSNSSLQEDNGSVIKLNNGLKATLIHGSTINVMQFGAKPDTDSREAIQKALYYAKDFEGTVLLPTGKLFYAYSLQLPEGVVFDGQGSTLKKPNLSAAPYNMTPEEMKWIMLLINETLWNMTKSTKLSIIKNITFDGNALEMWNPEDGYDQQQASLIHINAESKTLSPDVKVYCDIENCRFLNNVSDGIHLRANIVCNVRNCYSENCFRGGLTITGGNAFINVDNFVMRATHEGMPDRNRCRSGRTRKRRRWRR